MAQRKVRIRRSMNPPAHLRRNIRRRNVDPRLYDVDFNPLQLPDSVVRAANWARTVPELRTRPHLLAAMAEDPRLRRAFLHQVEQLISLVEPLYGLPHAQFVINLVFKHGLDTLALVQKRCPDQLCSAELIGAYRNVYLNVRWRLADGKAWKKLGKWDVRRKLYPADPGDFSTSPPAAAEGRLPAERSDSSASEPRSPTTSPRGS